MRTENRQAHRDCRGRASFLRPAQVMVLKGGVIALLQQRGYVIEQL